MKPFIKVGTILKQLRWHQWYKGLALGLALFWFDHDIKSSILIILIGAMVFNLTSSIIYIFNDIKDVDYDRRHPKKKKRPFASGKINLTEMYSLIFILLGLVLILIGLIGNPIFTLIILSYIVANILYTNWIKHIPYIDILLVSSFMGLRVASGFVLLSEEIVIPYVMFMIVFTMFYLLLYRLSELELMSALPAATRPVLRKYSRKTINFFLTILMMVSVILYFLSTAIYLPELIYTDILYFGFVFSMYEGVSGNKRVDGLDGLSAILRNRSSIILGTLLILVVVTILIWTL